LSFAGLALGAALIAAACSSAATTPVPADAGSTPGTSVAGVAGVTLASTTDPTLGEYLTGQNGMTLYVLTKDTPDTSSCSGTCATTWPPLVAPSGAMITGPTSATGTFATITRSDGIVQVTYNHMPLYYFSGDSKAGDTTGQGKNGVWFVAPVSGSIPSGGAATSAAPSAAETPAPSTAETPAPSAAASASGY
jgi:predicted lipoprotein with Yx(FWY)xxD motif